MQQGYDDTIVMFRDIKEDIDFEEVSREQWLTTLAKKEQNGKRIDIGKKAIETRIKNM